MNIEILITHFKIEDSILTTNKPTKIDKVILKKEINLEEKNLMKIEVWEEEEDTRIIIETINLTMIKAERIECMTIMIVHIMTEE